MRRHLYWRRIRSLAKAQTSAPTAPGVYAIGVVQSSLDLPTHVSWVYVGSSKKLRKRLGQHTPVTEKNVRLRQWLTLHRAECELWYATTESSAVALRTEKQLIDELQPEFNTQHKRKPRDRS